jgi:heme exporter protein C
VGLGRFFQSRQAAPVICGWLILGTISAFWVPSAKGFEVPDLARILFFHLPCALLAPIALLWAAFLGGRFLSKREPLDGIRLSVTWEICALFAILALTTGMVFSEVQWRSWWSWDPRQTSFLLVNLILFAGLVLKGSIADREKSSTSLAGYALVTMLPSIFLTFVYPRLPNVISLHPSNTIAQGGLDGSYKSVLYLCFFGFAALGYHLYSLRIRTELLRLSIENYGNMETHRNRSTGDGPTGPVVVPKGRS